jgi:hypothetical protein
MHIGGGWGGREAAACAQPSVVFADNLRHDEQPGQLVVRLVQQLLHTRGVAISAERGTRAQKFVQVVGGDCTRVHASG